MQGTSCGFWRRFIAVFPGPGSLKCRKSRVVTDEDVKAVLKAAADTKRTTPTTRSA